MTHYHVWVQTSEHFNTMMRGWMMYRSKAAAERRAAEYRAHAEARVCELQHCPSIG